MADTATIETVDKPETADAKSQVAEPGQNGAGQVDQHLAESSKPADADAAYKAAFDKLAEPTARDGSTADIDKIIAGLNGEAPKPEAKEEAKPEPKFGERVAKPESAEVDEVTARDQREKVVLAKRALGRTGQWSSEEIDAMPEDRLLERGQKAHAQWEATERYKKDMEKWKARARGQTAPADPATDDSPGRSGAEEGSAEPDDAERLPQGFGQLAEKIAEWDPDLRKQVERVAARDRKAIVESAAAEVEKAQRALVQTRVTYAADRLTQEFPALKDPLKLRSVKNKLNEWDPDGRAVLADDPSEFHALMRDACEVIFGREMRRQAQHARVSDNARVRNGQPDVASARQVPMQLTEEQKFQVAARLTAEYNGDQAKVSAALAKLGISF